MKRKGIKKKSSKEKPEKRAEPGKTVREPEKNIQWRDNIKTVRRIFPGPAKTTVPLRIAIDREAFVDVTAHIMKSMDEEVCGVLVGQVCEDDEGVFVHIRTIVTGTSARQGTAHVTFTQETWNHIHQQMETRFPDFDILGWYHSHPGFGVQFSEMDLFIQRNFFSSPTQIALVMDPLGGEKAVCVNTRQGIEYIDKFWVDGREHRTHRSAGKSPGDNGDNAPSNSHTEEVLSMVETRLNQVLQALEKQNTGMTRVLMVMVSLFLLLMITLSFYVIYRTNYDRERNQPPRMLQYVPVPVRIGNREALVGIGVVDWEIPPELRPSLSKTREEPGDFFQSIIDRARESMRSGLEELEKKQSETKKEVEK